MVDLRLTRGRMPGLLGTSDARMLGAARYWNIVGSRLAPVRAGPLPIGIEPVPVALLEGCCRCPTTWVYMFEIIFYFIYFCYF